MDLKVENLSVDLGKEPIVKNCSIYANKGEFVGIIGPNGSGKSTILKTIYGINKEKSGVIYIDGKELSKMKVKDIAKRVGVLGQFNDFSFDIKVKDMVLMGRSPHKGFLESDNKNDFNIVNESLKKVEMLEHSERNFLSLSGGEKQRVLLARALAQDVKILILDEPTNHLDIKYQIQILNIVKKLGITVLVALHDLNIAAAYCDRLYIMKDGNIKAVGKPKEVLTEEIIKEVYEVCSVVHKDKEPLFITYKYNY
ncbi:ABC transporter ATP-binding protein [Clostridium sp. Ade.TY]|uniref:ABC transporter ATP-binding protein n=1 Tax=Clostridium sp. Ade.TY TaxID=1391647 RepID=UPI0004075674|nr:ABC transporter ATP-binding protein [Clostridium sp. Ade.TY]